MSEMVQQSVRLPYEMFKVLKEYSKERSITITKITLDAFERYIKEEIDPWWEANPKEDKYKEWE